MSRFVVLVLAVLVFFWLLKRALGSRRGGDAPTGEEKGTSRDGASAVPELVPCARCGVLLPKEEALTADDAGRPAAARFFCCEEHRQLGSR